MAKSFDDPVTQEEVEAVARRLSGGGEGEPPQPASPEPAAAAPVEPAAPPAAEPAPETFLEPPAEAPPAVEAAPTGPFLEVGGRKYTPDDIIELQRGSLLQSDYTRRVETLKEERRLLDERSQIQAEREALLESFERGSGSRQEEVEPGEPKDPQLQKIEELTGRLEGLEQELREQRVARADAHVMRAYEVSVGSLHDRFNIPADLRPFIEARVFQLDPAVADENGRPFPEQQIRENVEKAYLEAYKPLHKFVQGTRAPAAPTTVRAKAPPPPGGGPAPRPAPPAAPAQRGSWEGKEAVNEFIGRMTQEPPSPEG